MRTATMEQFSAFSLIHSLASERVYYYFQKITVLQSFLSTLTAIPIVIDRLISHQGSVADQNGSSPIKPLWLGNLVAARVQSEFSHQLRKRDCAVDMSLKAAVDNDMDVYVVERVVAGAPVSSSSSSNTSLRSCRGTRHPIPATFTAERHRGVVTDTIQQHRDMCSSLYALSISSVWYYVASDDYSIPSLSSMEGSSTAPLNFDFWFLSFYVGISLGFTMCDSLYVMFELQFQATKATNRQIKYLHHSLIAGSTRSSKKEVL
ncbi:hypothetical protein M8C21_028045 [Ambrosia artemisiifolia]|uniref:Uncharacterized protein n=1 Tax=Ambrosia artemisiifolia TaxID=4212 RepID=A0AAD5C3J4_AMBAR|nr:hypothetical protein M8C21_028045 [Ambrosia artemisiifolia]